MLTHDELWEKAGTNEPITREDLGINASPAEKMEEGMRIMMVACKDMGTDCDVCPFGYYCNMLNISPYEWEIENE